LFMRAVQRNSIISKFGNPAMDSLLTQLFPENW